LLARRERPIDSDDVVEVIDVDVSAWDDLEDVDDVEDVQS
jgi:hypothetical protein